MKIVTNSIAGCRVIGVDTNIVIGFVLIDNTFSASLNDKIPLEPTNDRMNKFDNQASVYTFQFIILN